MSDPIRILNPIIYEIFCKTHYRSCIIRNRLQVKIGDFIGFRLNDESEELSFGRLITIYDDKCAHDHKSNLANLKGEVFIFRKFFEIPVKVNYDGPKEGYFISSINDKSIFEDALVTINLTNIVDARQVVYVDNSRDLTKSKNAHEPLKIHILGAFCAQGKLLNPREVSDKSWAFCSTFINNINNQLDKLKKYHTNSPLINVPFNIKTWLELENLKQIYPDITIVKKTKVDIKPNIVNVVNKSSRELINIDNPKDHLLINHKTNSKEILNVSVKNNSLTDKIIKDNPIKTNTLIETKDSIENINLNHEKNLKRKNNSQTLTKKTKISSPVNEILSQQLFDSSDEESIIVKSAVNLSQTTIKENNSNSQINEIKFVEIGNFLKECIKDNKNGFLLLSDGKKSEITQTVKSACEKFKNKTTFYRFFNCSNGINSKNIYNKIARFISKKNFYSKQAWYFLNTLFKNKHDFYTLLVFDHFENVNSFENKIFNEIVEWLNAEKAKLILIIISDDSNFKNTSLNCTNKNILFNKSKIENSHDLLVNEINNNACFDNFDTFLKFQSPQDTELNKYFEITKMSNMINRKRSLSTCNLSETCENKAEIKICKNKLEPFYLLQFLGEYEMENKNKPAPSIKEVYSLYKNFCVSRKIEFCSLDEFIGEAKSFQKFKLLNSFENLSINSYIKPNLLIQEIDDQ